MKSIFYFICIIGIVAAYLFGQATAPRVKQSDWVLAYEHWYETSKEMLKDDSLRTDDTLIKDLALAQSEIDSVYQCQIMQWPVVCDQRDKLSDVIRKYADNHPKSDIYMYVEETGIDPESLKNWSFAY